MSTKKYFIMIIKIAIVFTFFISSTVAFATVTLTTETITNLVEENQGILPNSAVAVFGLSLIQETADIYTLDAISVDINSVAGVSASDIDRISIYDNDGLDHTKWDSSDTEVASNDNIISVSNISIPVTADANLSIPTELPAGYTYNYFLVIYTSSTLAHEDEFTVDIDPGGLSIRVAIPVTEDNTPGESMAWEVSGKFYCECIGWDCTTVPGAGAGRTYRGWTIAKPYEGTRLRPDYEPTGIQVSDGSSIILEVLPMEEPKPILGLGMADPHVEFKFITVRVTNEGGGFDPTTMLDPMCWSNPTTYNGISVWADDGDGTFSVTSDSPIDLENAGGVTWTSIDATTWEATLELPDNSYLPTIGITGDETIVDYFICARLDSGYKDDSSGTSVGGGGGADGVGVNYGSSFQVTIPIDGVVLEHDIIGSLSIPSTLSRDGVTKAVKTVYAVINCDNSLVPILNDLTAPQHVDASSGIIPVLGINLADAQEGHIADTAWGGERIQSIRLDFSGTGFDTSDLFDLTGDMISGISLWKDNKSSGSLGLPELVIDYIVDADGNTTQGSGTPDFDDTKTDGATLTQFISTDKICYVDADKNLDYTLGEALFIDADTDTTYDYGEVVILNYGSAITSGTLARSATGGLALRYYDANANSVYDLGEDIIYELDKDGKWDDPNDTLVSCNAMQWAYDSGKSRWYVKITPKPESEVGAHDEDLEEYSGYDYFICVRTSGTLSYGDTINIAINDYSGDVDRTGIQMIHQENRVSGDATMVANLPVTIIDMVSVDQKIVKVSAPVPIFGINLFNDSATPMQLNSLVLEFYNQGETVTGDEAAFNPDVDLLALNGRVNGIDDDEDGTTDESDECGVLIYADADGDGLFSAALDTLLTTATPQWVGEAGEPHQLKVIFTESDYTTLKPWKNIPTTADTTDPKADLFITLRTSRYISTGDDFSCGIMGWGAADDNCMEFQPQAGGATTTVYKQVESGIFTCGSVVSDVSGLAGQASDASVVLTWTDPVESEFSGVLIVRRTDENFVTPEDGIRCDDGSNTGPGGVWCVNVDKSTKSPPTNSYTDTNSSLTNGIAYYYKVYGYDARPNYTSGTSVSATPNKAPSPITDFTATGGANQVSLSWTNPASDSDWTGTKIVRKATGYPASVNDGTVVYAGNVHSSWTDIGLTGAATYYYSGFTYNNLYTYSSAVTTSATTSSSSSTGGGGGGGGCFIATACYGTPQADEVKVLCRFRDECLQRSKLGQKAVSAYYRLSPQATRYIKDKEVLKAIARVGLKPVIKAAEFILKR